MVEIFKPDIKPSQIPGRINTGQSDAVIQNQISQEQAFGDSLLRSSQEFLDSSKVFMESEESNKYNTDAMVQLADYYTNRTTQIYDDEGKPQYGTLVSDLDEKSNEIQEEYLSKIQDPKAREKFLLEFGRYKNNQKIKALSIARQQQIQTTGTALNNYLSALITTATEGSQAEADHNLQAGLSAIEDSPLKQFQDVEAMKQSFKGELNLSRAQSLMKSNPEAAAELVNKLTPENSGIEPARLLAAQNQINAIQNASKSALTKKANEVTTKLTSKQEKGVPVTEAEMSVVKEFGTLGVENTDEKIKRYKYTNAFILSGAEARDKILNKVKAEDDGGELSEYLENINTKLRERAKEDPMALAADQGVIDIKPLDLNGNIVEQLQERVNQVSIIEELYDVDATGITVEEERGITGLYEKADTTQKLQLLGTLVEGLGSQADILINKLGAGSNNNLAFAASLVARGNVQAAELYLKGEEIRLDKNIPEPPSTKFNTQELNHLPNYSSNKVMSSKIRAIRNVYLGLAKKDNKLFAGVDPYAPDAIDEDLYEQAVKTVIGGDIIEFNESKLEPMYKNQTSDQFIDYLNSVNQEELEALGLDETTAIEVTSRLQGLDGDETQSLHLEQRDNGSYYMYRRNEAGDVQPVLDDEGKPFILDYNEIEFLRKEGLNDILSGEEGVDDVEGNPEEDILQDNLQLELSEEDITRIRSIFNKHLTFKHNGNRLPPIRNVDKLNKINTPTKSIEVAKKYLGHHEQTHAKVLSEFFKQSSGTNINPKDVPWCAAFVNAVLNSSGIKGSESNLTRSFLSWGEPTSEPVVGDVVVSLNGKHSGIVSKIDADGTVYMISGNYGDKVQESPVPSRGDVLYRKPPKVKEIKERLDVVQD